MVSFVLYSTVREGGIASFLFAAKTMSLLGPCSNQEKKKKKNPDPWQFELPLTLQVLVPPRHLVGKCLPPFSLWRKMSQIVMIPKMVLSQLAHCEPRDFENRTD